MKILYISVHSILEYDELTLLTELGHDVFSLGAYTDPAGHFSLPRPGVFGMKKREDLIAEVANKPKTELPYEFVNKFDAVIVMDGYSGPEIIERNWPVLKGKRVIWRTIGQSLPGVEKRMSRFKKEGLRIVRYSPMEKKLDNFAGEHALIRFYKDPEEFNNWNGNTLQVMNLSQSLKARRDFCGYDHFMNVVPGFPGKVYGNGNEDMGEWCGGELTYDAMKGALRDCRVYFYTGTWPASYTLSFIEALMTGTPIVAVSSELWKHKDHKDVNLYEVDGIIKNGYNGFVSHNYQELKDSINKLLTDTELARRISIAGRATALKLFSKERIKEEWKRFLQTL